MEYETIRRYSTGPEILENGSVHFRIWAPNVRHVSVVLEGKQVRHSLDRDEDGYFSGIVPGATAGDLYFLQLDNDPKRYPEPTSRFQPNGPHGASQVIDHRAFRWTDHAWPGVTLNGQIIYEMHVGTFTQDGTWYAAAQELPELAKLGITLVECMPIAEFPGAFGWGYDGVNLYAPMHIYGTPDDFRAFVNSAHELGIGVILDVVYNHVGPDGDDMARFSSTFFSKQHKTDWGSAINYDGAGSAPVRRLVCENAAYWIGEFHLDGLRLDATQNIYDTSSDHILAQITQAARRAAGPRGIIIIAENEPQQTKLVRSPDQGGYGMDALWNDDFHHSAMVAANGRNEAYYTDYRGKPQELISALKYGFLYQGQWYSWQHQHRGTPALTLPPAAFVTFIQNHDQIANSAHGERIHYLTSPGRFRALSALLLLGPGTPMIFQGQEFAASSPFLYFADHKGELGQTIRAGRAAFLAQFPSLSTAESQRALANPCDERTYVRSKLDLSERRKHAATYRLYGDLISLRRTDSVFSSLHAGTIDGAVLAEEAFVIRYFADNGLDRLLIVNLGADLHLRPAPEPLLAPPAGKQWKLRWSSEDLKYGGSGTPPLEDNPGWQLPGHAAFVMTPV